MVIGILQPSYLPWLGFLEQMHQVDCFVYYDDVQFEKGSWRNRNRIKTAQGPQWLTVPVLTKGGNFPLIKDIQINNREAWSKKHIKAIALNYAKAPYFETYAPGLFHILDSTWNRLLDLNLTVLDWLKTRLGITTPTVLSSSLKVPGRNVERLIGIIRHLGGNVFYEGKAGVNYIDPAIFMDAGITVRFQDYAHPTYPQLYGEFISHLSIIDLLFNCGPDSLARLSGTDLKRNQA